MTASPFATSSEIKPGGDADSMKNRAFGTRRRGRYKMPLLPGEQGPKGGGDWVPSGIQSVTNLIDGFEDQRGLQIWEQEGMAYGLAKQPSLYERITLLAARADREGIDFSRLGDTDTGKEIRRELTGGGNREDAEASIVGQAKQAAGFNEPREAGTNRHEAWSHFVITGELIGTTAMREQIEALAKLLAENQLQPIPDLSERVVRNTVVNTTGRFDNGLFHIPSGRIIMSDLKTKRRPHRSFASVEGQLATYARSDWMLDAAGTGYEEGPLHHVHQKWGLVLIMPSNGDAPYFKPADLEFGWRVALQARGNTELRREASSAAHLRREWSPELLLA